MAASSKKTMVRAKSTSTSLLVQAREAGAQHGTVHGHVVGEITKQVVGKSVQTAGRGLLFAGQYLASFGKNTVTGFARTTVK